MSTSHPEFGLSSWRGEFFEKPSEEAFRKHIAYSSARDLRVALWTWAGLLLISCLHDLLTHGVEGLELAVQATRAILICAILLLIRRCLAKPEIAASGQAVTLLELIGFCSLFVTLIARPESITYTYVIIILMIVAVFVVIPNQVIPATAASVFAVTGSLLCAIKLGLSSSTLMGLSLSLATTVGIGYLAARRLHLVQRRQYALLQAAEAVNLQLNAEIERRKVLEDELKQQAMTDPLTGLFNRRHFEFLFKRERQRAMRQRSSLSLCLVDLDYFKNVNDAHGHEVGDKVLQAAARLFVRELRQSDVTGRIGGEEFVLLLPDTCASEAHQIIDRLRLALASKPVRVNKLSIPVTATFAVTAVDVDRDSFASAMRSADRALYQGKDAGRNRVMMAVEA